MTEEYIPYLVIVRLDKGDGTLAARVAESAPGLKATLEEMGSIQLVENSTDAALMSFLVAADPRFENTLQVLNHLQSPRSKRGSALIEHDRKLAG